MKRVTLEELAARFKDYLALARAGEVVLIMERGEAVARLVAVSGKAASDAHLAELVSAGLVRPPERALPEDFWTRPLPSDPDGRSLEIVLEERAEGR